MNRTTYRALGIGMLVVVAVVCWIADLIALFMISGSAAFGGDPMTARQDLASQLVTIQGLAIAVALVFGVVAIGKRWIRSWWAVWSVATAMASVTTLAFATAAPIAASGECLRYGWADGLDCGISGQIRRDHVAAGLAAVALALTSITFARLAYRSARLAELTSCATARTSTPP